MLVLSGLFVPRDVLPEWLRHLPLSYAVSLLRGIWLGDAWSAHVADVAALALVFVVCMALSARLFRWE
jgi:ABC-2 type transport system permease protein